MQACVCDHIHVHMCMYTSICIKNLNVCVYKSVFLSFHRYLGIFTHTHPCHVIYVYMRIFISIYHRTMGELMLQCVSMNSKQENEQVHWEIFNIPLWDIHIRNHSCLFVCENILGGNFLFFNLKIEKKNLNTHTDAPDHQKDCVYVTFLRLGLCVVEKLVCISVLGVSTAYSVFGTLRLVAVVLLQKKRKTKG